ncbi:MAG: hypothetical protein AB1601_14185 [Planctomycetota bacterium]
MNVRAITVAPDEAVVTLVDGRELRITRAWLADRFREAPGRLVAEKRDATLQAVRDTYADGDLLPPERLWVDFGEDGTIHGVALCRDGACPFDSERWTHLDGGALGRVQEA